MERGVILRGQLLFAGNVVKKVLILLLAIAWPISAWAGVTYYVSNASPVGSDSNNGTSISSPWLTIAKINASTFRPGDSVLLNRGCTWREQLTVVSSGTSGNPITFGAYGSGANPVISGADLVGAWSNYSENVWQATVANQPNVVILSGAVGTKCTSLEQLTAQGCWFWGGGTLYLYSASSPASAYPSPGAEAGRRSYALYLDGCSYLNFNNIDLVAGNLYSIFMDGETSNIAYDSVGILKAYTEGINHQSQYRASYVVIQNSVAAFNGAVGILATGNTDHWTIQNNTVYNNGYTYEQGGVENTWGGGIKLVSGPGVTCGLHVIKNNTVYYNGYKGNGVARACPVPNKGFGIWVDTVGTVGNTVEYNNVFNNADDGIYIEKSSSQRVDYNLSHGNAGNGISVSDSDGINSSGTYNNGVYNNTSYGNALAGLAVIGNYNQSGLSVYNNTLENNISVGNGSELAAQWGGENLGGLGRGNIYSYNLLGPSSSNFIQWGRSIGVNVYYSAYSSWEPSYCGSVGCSHSVQADPDFVSTSGRDFRLQPGSPAIKAGTNVGLASDYAGNPVPGIPDVGAYEFTAPIQAPTGIRLISE